ncbi:MAG: insulinase family protein [Gemmatimonadota bacterium]
MRRHLSPAFPGTVLIVLLPLLLLQPATPFAAQEVPAGPLPLDPAVLTGTLPNGLTYFVRENGRPAARAELRLVVNAGSVLEDEGQRGLAHLVEHMAFNGTANFEKQELVDYLEGIGMAFGPSINAYTSFDETVYQLRVPTDDPEAFATGFQILEDWAHQLSFEPEEVDAERGVVVEEWRLGRGAQARLRDQQLPVMFRGSRYADRLPIGEVEVLQSFPHDELTRFYRRWYRPDLMAVVAVGDFDAADVVERIRSHFGRIPAPQGPPDRPSFTVPPHDATYFAIAVDPEASGSTVGLLTLQERDTTRTLDDYRDVLVEQLAEGMMNERLAELAQAADPPFAAAFSGRGSLVRTRSVFQLLALVPEDGHARGFRALLEESERAARHGFTPGELEREKLELMRGLERRYAERDNLESAGFAGQYVSHYLEGNAVPGIAVLYQAARELMPAIDLDDVNQVARRNLSDADRVVLADGVQRPGLSLPDSVEFRAILAEVEAAELAPWEDAAVDRPLMARLPTPGTVVEEVEMAEVGATEWRLSNGAVVWIKPTDFKDDEVVMRASSPGGWSRSPPAQHMSATNAVGVVQASGLGGFSRADLRKVLAGNSAAVSVGIRQTHEVLSGQASPRDLETLFQLVQLHFTSPRRDSAAFASMEARMRTVLENRSGSPDAAFTDTLVAALTQHHPRAAPASVERMAEIDLDQALAFYRDRFADASDFHFVLVGATDPEELRPLVERYLASLPGSDREDGWVDLGIDPPSGRVERVVRRGMEPRSRTGIVFVGPFEYTVANRIRMRALASVLEVRLRERLREDLGGTYSVRVTGGYEDAPEERYTVQIQFGADPERVEELQAVVFQEIERLKSEGPTPLDVQKALETERRSWETSREGNGWWASQLLHAAERHADPSYLMDETRFDVIDAENIQEDAARYLDPENVVVVTLLPEVPAGD